MIKMDLALPPPALLGIGALVLLAILYRLALPRPIPGIPYDKRAAKSILGDLPSLSAHSARTGEQRRWFPAQALKFNSPICQVFVRPWGKPRVVLTDFREMQDLLLRRGKEFDRSERAREAWVGIIPHQMLCYKTSDPKFKARRELMRDLMSPGFLNEVSAPEIFSKTSALVDLWKLKCDMADGQPFDVKVDVQRATLDVILAVSFGLSAEDSATKQQLDAITSLSKKDLPPSGKPDEAMIFPPVALNTEQQAMLAIMESATVGFSSPIPVWHHWFLRQFPKLKNAGRIKEEMTKREIDKAVQRFQQSDLGKKSHVRTALEYMVSREVGAAKRDGRSPRYHRRSIYDELFGYVIAGHDTTSATLGWGLIYLGDAQNSQTKLRGRLRDAFAEAYRENRQPTVSEITKTSIPYLDAVIEEILRLSAVIPIVSRESKVDTTILGHAIPKGTTVILAFNGPSMIEPSISVKEDVRNETSKLAKDKYGDWSPDDVGLFIPERWIELNEAGEEVYSSMRGPILTFGGGPRGCFGRRLGYLQLRILVALLVWNFEFLPVPSNVKSYNAVEHITVEPVASFVRLRKV